MAERSTEAATIAGRRWHGRILLIFASPGDARLQRQRRIVADAATAMAERQLAAVIVSGDAVDGASDKAAALRRRYAVPEGRFAVILIGKDGGEKLRAADPVPAETLFATIDAMPMRRNEMAAGRR